MERIKLTPQEIAARFKIRCSAILDICAGEIGLTEKQQLKYDTLIQRAKDFKNGVAKVKDLTDIMKSELSELQFKKDNPELPEGAKTYCKKWLKEFLYKRRAEIKSKYLDKGNQCEEDGFTLMCLELNLGMVYKNTEYFENEYICGTPDLFVRKIVYDNKCSYSLDTFPMFETENPKPEYEWQLNGYAELLKTDDAVLAYTLIDAPNDIISREVKWLIDPNDIYNKLCDLIYTKDNFVKAVSEYCPDSTADHFIEIPQEERIVKFEFKKDQSKINKVNERVPMCREYIISLLTK